MAAHDIVMGAAGASAPAVYVEDVFSTYLYTGTGANQNIVNGIDLATKGGFTWIKQRNTSGNHLLMTTNGGPTNRQRSNGQPEYVTSTAGTDFASFNSNGFSLGVNYQSDINTASELYTSWSFAKQKKFFDVVTYTGTGAAHTIAHNLGSVPGCIIVGSTTALGTDWQVYHSGLTSASYSVQLNTTAAQSSDSTIWNATAPTSSVFSVGTSAATNYNGTTFVALLFASNAGGFGLTGTDNVISCGSVTVPASGNATVTLGYEPQWVLLKRTDSSSGGNWLLFDVMRGMSNTSYAELYPNTSSAESASSTYSEVIPTATGFIGNTSTTGTAFINNATYIYIAIRRGPMKVPTDATKVFNTVLNTGTGGTKYLTGVGFPPDIVIVGDRDASTSQVMAVYDKLRGPNQRIKTSLTDAEDTASNSINYFSMDGVGLGANPPNLSGGYRYSPWFFRRAPGFCDEVCYTGTGSAATFTHNLGVAPELMIVKKRSTINGSDEWQVYAAPLSANGYLWLNDARAYSTASVMWNNTAPTAFVFTVGTYSGVNNSGSTYVALLFASCPGVSKIGGYTGTGATQTINCGFTGGARFVLIKRTDAANGWYVWDTARGMVSGTDPYLLLHTPAAESNVDSVFSTSGGFQLAGTGAGYNANGGSYLYLAIA